MKGHCRIPRTRRSAANSSCTDNCQTERRKCGRTSSRARERGYPRKSGDVLSARVMSAGAWLLSGRASPPQSRRPASGVRVERCVDAALAEAREQGKVEGPRARPGSKVERSPGARQGGRSAAEASASAAQKSERKAKGKRKESERKGQSVTAALTKPDARRYAEVFRDDMEVTSEGSPRPSAIRGSGAPLRGHTG